MGARAAKRAQQPEKVLNMNYKVVNIGSQKYIQCFPGKKCLETEHDAIDLVAACGENDTQWLMVFADNLSDDFYRLSSGVAGNILLKFSNYHIRVAAVLTPELVNQGRFREMVIETNRGNQFRVFYGTAEAERWLIGA